MASEQHQPSPDIRLHELAEKVGTEFRKALNARTDGLTPYSADQVDAIYDLLARGVIEVGPGAFA